MAEDVAGIGDDVSPVLSRGLGHIGTPDLPSFVQTGNYKDDCWMYKIFINHFRERKTWGLVIFRTVYTPESDQQFVSALAKIETHIRYSLSLEPYMFESDRHPAERQRLIDIIMSHYQNTIFEDKQRFDKATAKDLTPYFRLWLADIERSPYPWPCYGYSNFAYIDEESLRTIAAAPDVLPAGQQTMSPAATIQIVRANTVQVWSQRTLGLWEEYHNGSEDHD